jgi:glutamate synthase (NADPH/NADH) large chain
MSLLSMIGLCPNLLGHDARTHKRLEVEQPITLCEDLAKIRSVEAVLDGAFRCETLILRGTHRQAQRSGALKKEMC